MTSFPSRRDFLLSVTGAGLSLPLTAQSSQKSTSGSLSSQIENDFFSLAYDAKSGRLHCWHKDGGEFLSGITARANLKNSRRSTSEPAYQHTMDVVQIHDKLGDGRQLIVQCIDAQHQLDFTLRYSLYDGRQALLIEAECRNMTSQPLIVKSLGPFCALREDGGYLKWPGVTKILTNGPMYFDPGVVADFIPSNNENRRSWWNIGFFRGYDQMGLVCGYIQNDIALGQLEVRAEPEGQISILADSVYAPEFEIPPGKAFPQTVS